MKQNNVVYPNPCFLLGATIDKTLFYGMSTTFSYFFNKLEINLKKHPRKMIFGYFCDKTLRNKNLKTHCFQPLTLGAGTAAEASGLNLEIAKNA